MEDKSGFFSKKDKKKLFFFVSSLERPGGIERVVSAISSSLALEYWEVTILTLYRTDIYFKLAPEVKVSYLYPRKKSLYKNFIGYIFRLCFFLRSEKPSFLITVGASLCLLSVVPSLFTHTKNILWEHFSTKYKWNSVTSVFSRRLAALFCHAIIVLTTEDKAYYKKKRAKIVVELPNPVSLSQPDLDKKTKTEKIVLSVGRLVNVKGFDLLLSSWQQIENKDGWKLYIVGEGNEKEKLETLISSYRLQDCVCLLPPTNHIESYYTQASVYALSSRSECFPLVLLEAATCGVPIVAYNCGEGPRELVKNGYNGFLVPLNDTSAFSEKLSVLMFEDRIRDLYSSNSKKIAANYSLPSITEKWNRLLDSL